MRWAIAFVASWLAVLLVSSARADEPAPVASKLDSTTVERGALVTITGQGLPPGGTVRLDDVAVKLADPPGDGTTLKFWIPQGDRASADSLKDLQLGAHAVHVFDASGKEVPFEAPANRRLTVVTDAPKMTLTEALPPLIYPTSEQGKLTLVGEGFSEVGADQTILLDDLPVPVCWATDCPKGVLRAAVQPGGRQIVVDHFPMAPGAHKLALRRQGETTAAVTVVLAKFTLSTLKLLAALAVAGVFATLLLLAGFLSRGEKRQLCGRTYGFFRLLFLDPETDSYSLSALQFYAWTAAVGFGCTYFALVRAWVQWRFDVPDVPEHLPSLIAISAGTTVGAIGIQTVKGPNGAGRVLPSFADFLTVGGVIAPERFQFLFWTVLGVAGFVLATLNADPVTLKELPNIPENVLFLMGASSAGYLGGKLARRPGPVVDKIARVSGLVLEVQGRGLSPSANVSIGARDVTSRIVPPDAPARTVAGGAGDDLQRSLRLEFPSADEMAKAVPPGESPLLTVINPDGQRAEWPLDAEAPTTQTAQPSSPQAPPPPSPAAEPAAR
jgi:hypothetical protein